MIDKRAIIAQALLDRADGRRRLLDAGVPDSVATYELKRASKDPLFQLVSRMCRDLSKSYWLLGNIRRLNEQRASNKVPTVDKIDTEAFFSDYYFNNRPVKLTGLVDHWPALERWSLDDFAERFGDTQVELQAERDRDDNYELYKLNHRRLASMKVVVDGIRQSDQSNAFYITAFNSTTNNSSLAGLWDDIKQVSILESSGERDGFFWLGPKGTLTPFHHDMTNNLLIQVMGRKRVTLIAPWELPRVRNHVHVFSEIALDELRSGEGDLPDSVECVIGPGEAIFLPVGWWHHVEALDVSASMSFTNFREANDFSTGHPEPAIYSVG